jgi:hypothetical protein
VLTEVYGFWGSFDGMPIWQNTQFSTEIQRQNFNIVKKSFKNVKIFLALIKLKCILIISKNLKGYIT